MKKSFRSAKRGAALALAACIVSSMTACSGGNAPETTTADSGGGDGAVAEITFWDMPWGPAQYLPAAQALVERFNEEHPDIHVAYQSIPWDGANQAFNLALASDAPLDVCTSGGYDAHLFAARGDTLPLDDVIKEMEADGLTDYFVDGSLEQFQMNGEQIALPWTIDPKGIFYRKDMLEEAGLEVPKTWDDLFECCKVLTKDGIYGMAIAGANQWGVEYFMYNNGGSYVNKEMQGNYMTPENKQALEFLRSWKDEGIIAPGSAGYLRTDAAKLFLQGKAAFVNLSCDFSVEIKDQGEEFYNNVELLPPLTSPSGNNKVPMGVNGMIGFKKTKHPEAVKTFIRWWSENSDSLWQEGGMGPFPAVKAKHTLSAITENKMKKTFATEVIPNCVSLNYPCPNAFPAMSAIEGEELSGQASSMCVGTDKSIDDIMTTIDGQLQKIIEATK